MWGRSSPWLGQSMKLKKMKVTGFKNLLDHQFTFGLKNLIQGDRSSGKTALLEAIVWCLGGCDLQGNTRHVLKRYKNSDTKVMTVTTYWEFQDEETSRLEVISRSANGRTTIRRNGHVVTQESMDELFSSVDTFLSVFLPGYLSRIPVAKFSHIIHSMLPSTDVNVTSLMMQLHDLTKELSETEAYIQDQQHKLKMIKLEQSFSKGDLRIRNELQACEEKLQNIRSSISLDEPSCIQEMEREREQLGKRYHALVAEWQEVSKHDDSAQRLKDIQKECQSLLDRGYVLKKEIESSTKQYQLELKHVQEQQLAEEQILLVEIQRLKNRMDFKNSVGQRARIEKNIDDAIKERTFNTETIDRLQQEVIQHAQLQVDTANHHLKDCSIRITSKQSREQLLFQYQLMYKGVDFYSLSVSEKVICSLELSELIYQIKKERIPVFVDSMEPIREKVNTQLFQTQVTTDDMIIVA